MKESEDEYDPLPSGLIWRMKFAKKEKHPNTGCEVLRVSANRIVKTACMNTEYRTLKLIDRHASAVTSCSPGHTPVWLEPE